MTWRWEKLGLVFQPDRQRSWMQSHASLPVPVRLRDQLFRVFFASRDQRNRSHVGYFDIDLDSPKRLCAVSEKPVLKPGHLGEFDDHGVYAASAVRRGGSIYLYTIGWNPGSRAPLFYSSIGLAVSEDGGTTFQKHGRAPIMARSDFDPCLVTSPFVLNEADRWRMWYVSGLRWEETGQTLKSYYHIKTADSTDGVRWARQGNVAIDFATVEETNLARPWVVRVPDGYQAWFSFARGQGYRIGFAVSPDGQRFERKDIDAGIALSDANWENEMIAHPAVVSAGKRWFMFYNGNGFGRDGIALAVAEARP